MNVLLEARDICKSFGPTRALAGVDFDLMRGEIHGLIGENGSGKSTLTSIIAGIQQPDSGAMTLGGAPYRPQSVLDAGGRGVCMIVQEQGSFASSTVAQNIFIGNEGRFVRRGILDVRAMNAQAAQILKAIDSAHIRPDAPCARLSFEDRKLVEVARAAYARPTILIVDETTTSFTQLGREILYRMMDAMKADNRSVIFISHDIDEVTSHCDRITILRDGQMVQTLEGPSFDKSHMRRQMVGRAVSGNFYRQDDAPSHQSQVALSFDHVSRGILKDVSLSVRKGEIVGIGGLADCGIHDIGRLAFGLDPPDSGAVRSASGAIIKSPVVAMKCGIGYVSKNRDKESLMIQSSIRDNTVLPSLGKLSRGSLLFPKPEKAFVNRWVDALRIKMPGVDSLVSTLSGGNKQKVAISKWLGFDADVLVLDCPTRGIDIGVKASIYRLMESLKAQGKAILMISEELPELIGMSDRMIILNNGRVTAEFERGADITQHKIIEFMV